MRVVIAFVCCELCVNFPVAIFFVQRIIKLAAKLFGRDYLRLVMLYLQLSPDPFSVSLKPGAPLQLKPFT